MAAPPFPAWLMGACIIGRNADGESLAVGWTDNGGAWLARLNKFTDTWCSVRQATPKDIDDYDNNFLAMMMAAGRDTRSVEPPAWRLY